MINIYDKAQWHIDAGEKEEIVVKKFKILFDFLNEKNLLTDEGKEIIEIGVDCSVSIHERMVTKEGKEFMTNQYDKIINVDVSDYAEALEKCYK